MQTPHNVKLVVDVALVHGGRVLLTRYANPERFDGQSGLFLPNDLLLDREDPDDAVRRVLRDQLGVDDGTIQLAFAESFTGMDRTWHLALHFRAAFDEEPLIRQAWHLAEPQWFALNGLPPRGDVAHGGWALKTLARLAPPDA
jgi:ADP-ribose pyrophosphatase YjhB (NUDIX family)